MSLSTSKTRKINPLIIFLTCYFAYTSIYIARLNLSMASVSLTDSGLVNASQYGLFGTVFSVVYAVGRLFGGKLADRVPVVIPIGAGLLLAGISNVLTSLLPPFAVMLVLWGFNAMGQSLLWGAVLRTMAAVYPPEKVKPRTSVMVSTVAVGNILGILLGTLFIRIGGVGFAFLIPGVIALAACAVSFAVLPAVPSVPTAKTKGTRIFALLGDKALLMNGVPVLFHGLVKDNVSLFMALYFASVYGIDLNKIALFAVFIPAVGLVGRLLYPLFYRLTKENEIAVNLGCFALSAVCAVPLFFAERTPVVLTALCMSMIYALLSMINTSALSIFPLSYRERGTVAEVSGWMDLFAYLGSALGAAVYGVLADDVGFLPVAVLWCAFCALGLLTTLPLLKRSEA